MKISGHTYHGTSWYTLECRDTLTENHGRYSIIVKSNPSLSYLTENTYSDLHENSN